MPFIIWGTKGVESAIDSGRFTCPNCGPAPYTHKVIKRYFTLYWIPLFPVSTAGDAIFCDLCDSAWDTAILAHHAEMEAFEKRLRAAGIAMMAAMVAADGEVDDAEIAIMVKASNVLSGEPLTEAEARKAAEGAEDLDPSVVVRQVAGDLNEEGRGMLFRVALAIAAADGEVSDEEKLLLTRVGEALGMDVTEALAGLFEDGPEA